MFEPFGDRLDLNNSSYRGWRWRARRLTLHRRGCTSRETNKDQRQFDANGDSQLAIRLRRQFSSGGDEQIRALTRKHRFSPQIF